MSKPNVRWVSVDTIGLHEAWTRKPVYDADEGRFFGDRSAFLNDENGYRGNNATGPALYRVRLERVK